MLARLIIAGSLLVGCTVQTDVPVRIVVAETVGDIQFLDVFALTGGCPDSPLTLVDEGTRFSDTRAFEIPSAATAIAAFAILDCRRVAYACQPLAGSADITVLLEPLDSPQGLCTAEQRCQENGLCGMPDVPPRCEAGFIDPEADEDDDRRSNGEECGGVRECFSEEACGEFDEDGDGTPDWLDPSRDTPDVGDADGDGLSDLFECCDDGACPDLRGCFDTDRDGVPDYQDPDSDGDGIPDLDECRETDCISDMDEDGFIGVRDMDADGDGLVDGRESDRGIGRTSGCAEAALSCGSCGGCTESTDCPPETDQCTPSLAPFELRYDVEGDVAIVLVDLVVAGGLGPVFEIVPETIDRVDSGGFQATIAGGNLPVSVPIELFENELGFEQCVAGVCIAVVTFGAVDGGRLLRGESDMITLAFSNLKITNDVAERLFRELWVLGGDVGEARALDRGWNQLAGGSVVELR